jgi:hypothetical protein
MPYYHNENNEPATNRAQTSSENGVEFKHLGTNLSQLCCADSYDKMNMKFVASLQAVQHLHKHKYNIFKTHSFCKISVTE